MTTARVRMIGMRAFLMSAAVRTWFAATSRVTANARIEKWRDRYLALSQGVKGGRGAQKVPVPWMPGIDADMRNWSFYMILEHNVIVNRSITAIVQSLACGREPAGAGAIDPKRDVMPSAEAGEEAVQAFRSTVEAHLKTVANLGRLRGGRKKRHPVFGEFDAHHWHCMLGFHLQIHYRQARCVVGKARATRGSPAAPEPR